MPRLAILAILGLGINLCSAQFLKTAEYFLNSDPGPGKGTALISRDGSFDNFQELISEVLSAVELFTGTNRIGVRFCDSQSRWGNAAFIDVQVVQKTGLTGDPPLPPGGSGSETLTGLAAGQYAVGATAFTRLNAGDGAYDGCAELTTTGSISASSLGRGIQRLALQFQDTLGRWGNAGFVDVLVENRASLTPEPALPPDGPGSGRVRTTTGGAYSVNGAPEVMVEADDGAYDTSMEETVLAAIASPNLSVGTNRLALRFRDSEGRWGLPAQLDLLVQDARTLVPDPPLQEAGLEWVRTAAAAAYSLNGGPEIAIGPRDDSYDTPYEETAVAAIAARTLTTGTHRVSIRFRDSEGRWGNPVQVQVSVHDANALPGDPPLPPGESSNPRTISAGRVFLGSREIPSVLPNDEAFDSSFEYVQPISVAAPSLTQGSQRLALRFRDTDGRWGSDAFLDVMVHESSALLPDPPLPSGPFGFNAVPKLMAAEIFLDEDPGPGRGLSGFPDDGFFDSLAEQFSREGVNVTELAHGTHRVGVRFMDATGTWGTPGYLGITAVNPSPEGPSISIQLPASQIQPPLGNALFTVSANGTDPLFYQWLKEGRVLPRETNVWLQLTQLTPTDAGSYHVIITNGFGSVTSQVSRLIVRGATYAPEVVVQPASRTVLAGSNVVLNTLIDASWPVHYQWFKDDVKLDGSTTTRLVLGNAQPTNSGVYWLVASNDFGSVATDRATVNVDALMAFVDDKPLLGTNHFEGDILVRFVTTFNKGTIFYTLNGQEPDFGANAYSGPFVVNRSCTLRAVAFDETFSTWDEMTQVRISMVPLLTLSTASAGGGSVSLVPPGGLYRRGTQVQVTAVPDTGWQFAGWMGDSLETAPMLTMTLTNNRHVEAVFGTRLSVVATGNGTVALDPRTDLYPYGTTVRLSALPAEGSFFVAWGSAGSGTNNPLSLSIRSPDPTVTCLFGALAQTQHAFTALTHGFGRVSVTPRGNRFVAGQSVTVTAVPETGQQFIGWTGAITSNSSSVAVTMNSNVVLHAWFTSRPILQPDLQPGEWTEGFRLLLKSEFGKKFSVFWSDDLVQWRPLLSGTNNFGSVRLLDDSSAGAPWRFYQAIVEQ